MNYELIRPLRALRINEVAKDGSCLFVSGVDGLERVDVSYGSFVGRFPAAGDFWVQPYGAEAFALPAHTFLAVLAPLAEAPPVPEEAEVAPDPEPEQPSLPLEASPAPVSALDAQPTPAPTVEFAE